jgi:endogenous inhibitor of DNA gyrase (YacG/DUF329 family)
MHNEWSKRTDSGLPILKRSAHPWYVRFDRCNDPGVFTAENDHNPFVAAVCPECHGLGRWAVNEGGIHHDFGCPRCNCSGVIDEAVRLFAENKPPALVEADLDGRTRCTHCGVRFRISDPAVWTGRRHSCGQRLIVIRQGPDARTDAQEQSP